ncbi:MAG: TlpA disulfide reductase family protein [Bacteroidota bacterium]
MLERNILSGIVLIVALQLVSLTAFSQNKLAGTFVLTGDLSKYRISADKVEVTLRKPAGGFVFDSVKVINNKFEYRLELKEPTMVLLTVHSPKPGGGPGGGQPGAGPQDYMSIYAYPSVNQLKITDGTLSTAIVEGEGAAVFREYKKLYNDFSSVSMRAGSVISQRGVTDRAMMTVIRDSLMAVADETVLKPFITANPRSIVSIWAILEYSSRPLWSPRKNLEPEMISSLFSPMPTNFKNLPAMVMLGQSLQTAIKTKPGKLAMDFTLLDTNGKAVKLSDFRGKTVFIDFWASWCLPCRKENPNVLKLYNQYKSQGLVVLSISLDNPDKRAAWLKAIADDAIGDFIHVSDLKGFASQPALLYDVKAIPTNFIIDAQGKFIARNVYREELGLLFSKLFKQTGR